MKCACRNMHSIGHIGCALGNTIMHTVGDYNTGGDHLDIRCLGAQGNHQPLWFTDNPALRDDLGAVVTVAANNYQVVESSYTAR